MKHTKLITILLALLLCAALLTACGGEKPEETQPALTLPTVEAPLGNGSGEPAGTESAAPVPAGPEQASLPTVAPLTPLETVPGLPSQQGGAENPPDDRTPEDTGKGSDPQPAPSQPTPSQPAPSQPTPSQNPGAVYDDSSEDLPGPTGGYPDDTDEDLG